MKIKISLWMLISSFALLSISGSSCQNKKMEEEFKWSGTLSAPREYPVEVYNGELISTNYTQKFKNWGIINSGWGNASGTVVSGPEEKNVPDSLKITWLSFVENKFYSGKFALPKDKMKLLFKEGFTNDIGKHVTYSDIIVGLAPGGTVSVWLMAAGVEVEVAQFKATPTQIDPESVVAEDRYMFNPGYIERTLANDMIITPEIKSKINDSGFPPVTSYKELYPKKYNWKPIVLLPEGGKTEDFRFAMYNGEMETLIQENVSNDSFKERAVPVNCAFYWKAVNGKEHGVKVNSFNEKEIFNAFNEVGTGNIQLVFKVSGEKEILISLKNDSKEINIKKAVVKAF